MTIKLLTNWMYFARDIDELCDGQLYAEHCSFRGHGQESYELITSFDREVQDSLKGRNAAFGNVLEHFRSKAATFMQRPLSDEQWIALAQHYGRPTRVLDWTLSPYVAALFAVSDYLRSHHKRLPVIWVLDKVDVSNNLDINEIRFIDYYPDTDARIKNQKGVFSEIRGDVESLAVFLDGKWLSAALRKMRISRSVIPDAIRGLSLMNISYERLFPGAEGIAKQVWFDFQATR